MLGSLTGPAKPAQAENLAGNTPSLLANSGHKSFRLGDAAHKQGGELKETPRLGSKYCVHAKNFPEVVAA